MYDIYKDMEKISEKKKKKTLERTVINCTKEPL